MELNEYQERAMATAIYPNDIGLMYPAMKLCGEAGEFTEKVAKMMRDGGWRPGDYVLNERHVDLVKELGDVLWYIAACARDLGVNLDHIAEININKLADRAQRGALQGSGDDR